MNTNNLKQMEDELIDSIQQCCHCKMCLSACPTYEGWFTQTSIGRLAAIYAHLRYGLGSAEELSNLRFSCTTCRRCKTLCGVMSAGVDTTDIIVKARNLLSKRAEAGGERHE